VARVVVVAAQLIAIGAAAWFLVVTTRNAWPRLAALDVAPGGIGILPLLLASLLTAATYFFLIGTWVWSLRWWDQHVAYRDAVSMWFLTNLARFIPGTIWQFAGLGAMAVARGVSAVAATGAVLLQQVVLLATGLLLTVAMAPNLLGPWTAGLSRLALLAIAAAGAVVFVWAFPRLAALVRPLIARLTKREFTWPRPPTGALAAYVAGLIGPWIAYGIAFWLFGRSVLGSSGPGLGLSMAGYTASYVAGIIAILAPGGIVVREAALVAALGPTIGNDAALLLAVGSRVWLTAVEVITATVALLAVRRHGQLAT
jgi:hypothetical protein